MTELSKDSVVSQDMETNKSCRAPQEKQPLQTFQDFFEVNSNS